MAHDRKLVLSGIALTTARNNRHGMAVMTEVRDKVESLMIETGYADDARFKWVGLSLRYGLKNDAQPVYDRIDETDGELPIAIELDTHELQCASREELKRLFMVATLKALIHVAERYGRPCGKLRELKREYTQWCAGSN